jgi:hypothetical protein
VRSISGPVERLAFIDGDEPIFLSEGSLGDFLTGEQDTQDDPIILSEKQEKSKRI